MNKKITKKLRKLTKGSPTKETKLRRDRPLSWGGGGTEPPSLGPEGPKPTINGQMQLIYYLGPLLWEPSTCIKLFVWDAWGFFGDGCVDSLWLEGCGLRPNKPRREYQQLPLSSTRCDIADHTQTALVIHTQFAVVNGHPSPMFPLWLEVLGSDL